MTGWLSLTPSFVHEAYSHPYVPEMQAHHSVPPLQPPIMPPPPMVFMPPPPMAFMPPPKADNPREIRNKAEKQRRDKLNQSIAELASLVPPVVHSTKKIDKTGVLRYTAHYLRAHQYVFRSSPLRSPQFSHSSAQALLSLMNGFLLSTTYKGLIVVVSQNINEYLGYTELELLGKSIFPIVHEDDHQLLRDQLMPRSQALGHQGELLLPNDLQGRKKAAKALANEKRRFMIRLLKLSQRSEPSRYVTCHVEGSFRMSDQALQGHNRCCQMVRRARARGDNPCSSGNDVVFIGVVRPCMESFINESVLESYQMEYRTRHSIDGEIIECEQRIALVTGYMMSEVSGVNAMNFIHRDEVRWVIIALKEMYNQNQLYGESCYRLMTKNSQFIYMRTRGRLDVDASSRSVTSFVCTNTVVCEEEGKHLIRMMKERFTLQANYEGHLLEDIKESSDSQAVEDPRQLEKEILNMVTTLPSVDETSSPDMSPSDGEPTQKLALIPPEKKRIVSAIEKIYTVIKTIPKQPSFEEIEPEIYEDNPHMYEKKLPVDEIIQPFEEITDAITPTRSEVSNLPQFNPYFQTQSSSEAENSEVYSPVPSSDFDSVMTDSREEMASVMEIEYIEDMEFEIYSTNECEESNDPLPGQQEVAGSILPNEGVKHPICEDEKMTSKKTTVVKSTAANDSASDHNAPTLETFFNDDVMMGQIQSAMEALNEMEPGFTDFLSTREVEDILGPNQSETT